MEKLEFNQSQVLGALETASGKFMSIVKEEDGKLHNYLIPVPIYNKFVEGDYDTITFDEGVAGEGDYENWTTHRDFTIIENSVRQDSLAIKKVETKVALASVIKEAAKAGISQEMLQELAPGLDLEFATQD